MVQFVKNILDGVKQWVNDIVNEKTFVISSHINELWDKTQEKLIAGKNISIKDNEISALGYTYNATKNSFAEGNSTASGTSSHSEGYQTIASNTTAHAEGQMTTASGLVSHAEGGSTEASETCSHAEGDASKAMAEASHAEGYQTKTRGKYSHSEGYKSEIHPAATGPYNTPLADGDNGYASHAEGNATVAVGSGTHSEGKQTVAFGYNSHAEGVLTTTPGRASHAEGCSTYSVGDYSHSEGCGEAVAVWAPATSTSNSAIISVPYVEGNSPTSDDIGSIIAEGTGFADKSIIYKIIAVDTSSNPILVTLDRNSIGGGTNQWYKLHDTAYGEASHVEGSYNTTIGYAAHAEGSGNFSSGDYSHTEGDSNVALGQSSHVEGGTNIAAADCAHAEGAYTAAAGMCAHSEGFGSTTNASFTISGAANTTTYTMSVADPNFLVNTIVHYNGVFAKVMSKPTTTSFIVDKTLSATQALNNATIQIIKGVAYASCSHAEGYSSNAVGLYSHAEGYDSVAEEYCGHAEGRGTKAGNLSHAEGDTSIAKGQVSHAEGLATQALGHSSHSEGYNTVAGESYSHAEGECTVAQNEAEHAEGSYNISHDIAPFEYVDLGLSVLWAGCNLGATNGTTKESWYGNFYAWGETEPKDEYLYANYKYSKDANVPPTGTQWEPNFIKYCSRADCGYENFTDGKTILEDIDDAVKAHVGNDWRTPTNAELEELAALPHEVVENYKGINGLKGVIFTGINGNKLFIPLTGYYQAERSRESQSDPGYTPGYVYEGVSAGIISNSTGYEDPASTISIRAMAVRYTNRIDVNNYARVFGYSVRPVRSTNSLRKEKHYVTQHSIGIGSLNNRKNAVEVMDNGDVYVYGVGNYQGTDIAATGNNIQTLLVYIASLEARIQALENQVLLLQ